jgi:hypothetical protein
MGFLAVFHQIPELYLSRGLIGCVPRWLRRFLQVSYDLQVTNDSVRGSLSGVLLMAIHECLVTRLSMDGS